ncbi:MAG TPA: GNAT family N-acetyltransferase [Pseudonocardia sp.]|nr:GNAT family N-acetyltransferase [Pseudonocardia sp.]
MELRPVAFDHPDAVRLTAEIQQVYVERYGDTDRTPVDPADFAPPRGYFTVGYLRADGPDGPTEVAVASGGWRARDGGGDPGLRDGDAEVKRMYVVPAHRGRGFARALLAELERSAAAAGRLRVVLETGTRQPEAIALYASAGYTPIPGFGVYRCAPESRCYAKLLPVPTGVPEVSGAVSRAADTAGT